MKPLLHNIRHPAASPRIFLDTPPKNINNLMHMLNRTNDYEQAFADWLIDNGVKFVAIDQQKRAVLRRNKIKSFDFLLYPAGCRSNADSNPWSQSEEPAVIVTEVKGRLFKGKTLQNMSGLQCWVTMEDIRGMLRWQEQFDSPHEKAKAVFVFAYRFELPWVDADRAEVHDYADRRYTFYAVDAIDYMTNMKIRSPRWQTVMLSATKFRQLAVPVRQLLFNHEVSQSYV